MIEHNGPMTRPHLLDLFCGAGGAARGYQMAGFHVTGVDHVSQPRYAGDVFIEGDARAYLTEHGGEYDAIHASPPCQEYSVLRHRTGKHYPDLVATTRALLQAVGVPWVIENVPGAPLGAPILLCGTMFGLRAYRHRLFESPWLMFLPMPQHPRHTTRTCSKKRRAGWDAGLHVSVTGDVGVYVARDAMGISWMTGAELSQAIPPAYTAWIGERLLAALGREKEKHYDLARDGGLSHAQR